jgi:cob(I)alamin adenosyltransferase
MRKGYVQVYTGNGKGKTTAALGLTLRAAGAGHRVFIGQFTKGNHYSELNALKRFDELVTLRQFGTGSFIFNNPSDADREFAQRGLAELKAAVLSGEYDLVIFEEANIAVHYGLLSVSELLEIIKTRPAHVELVFTGRNAHPDLIEAADLVTEMKEIKHYYKQGVQARPGIEK